MGFVVYVSDRKVIRVATQFNKFNQRQNFKTELIKGAYLVGKYDMPQLKKTNLTPNNLITFNKAMTEKYPFDKWVHFFIDDYQFERLWNFPTRYLELLKKFEGVIAPDYSMLSSMPKAQQIWNCYRNRTLTYWLQQNNIKILPTVEWSEYRDLEWSLDGLPKNSTLVINSYGCNKSSHKKYGLIKGLEKVCCELAPSSLVMYGKEIKAINSLCKSVIWLENYCQVMKKRL